MLSLLFQHHVQICNGTASWILCLNNHTSTMLSNIVGPENSYSVICTDFDLYHFLYQESQISSATLAMIVLMNESFNVWMNAILWFLQLSAGTCQIMRQVFAFCKCQLGQKKKIKTHIYLIQVFKRLIQLFSNEELLNYL